MHGLGRVLRDRHGREDDGEMGFYYQYKADRARRTLRGIDEQVKKADSHHEAFDEVGLDVGTPVLGARIPQVPAVFLAGTLGPAAGDECDSDPYDNSQPDRRI
jgi:hypothetical protein